MYKKRVMLLTLFCTNSHVDYLLKKSFSLSTGTISSLNTYAPERSERVMRMHLTLVLDVALSRKVATAFFAITVKY